jgi:hypothetical protein
MKCFEEHKHTGMPLLLKCPPMFDWAKEFCEDGFIATAWVQVELDMNHRVQAVKLRATTNQTLGKLSLEAVQKWRFKEMFDVSENKHMEKMLDTIPPVVVVFEFQVLAFTRR